MTQFGSDWSYWPVVHAAIQEVGTPLYLYFPQHLRKAYDRVSAGLRVWGQGAIAYSLKTNPFLSLVQDLKKWGAWVEVVSSWEYQLALRAGFNPAQVILNGPLKPKETLEAMATWGLFTINVDSTEELKSLTQVAPLLKIPIRVGLRICPDKQNGNWSRFGLQVETGEFDDAIRMLAACPLLKLVCIHFHLGTQTEPLDRYFHIIDFAQGLWNKMNFDTDVWLDLGGGYPYQHDRPLDLQAFDPISFFGALRERWRFPVRPSLLIEPGRWICSSSFAIVSRVLALKKRVGEPTIVVLDSGTNHNVMAAFYEHQWVFERTQEQDSFRICGPLCMEDDILSGPISAKRPAINSLIVMLNAGAYSFSLSRTFIQPRPPVVRIDGGTYQVLVERESMDTVSVYNEIAY
jgi:diaminopimelate decarboxylase